MINKQNIGSIIIISGPSGVGKSTICKRILNRRKDISLSVSYTTRNCRKDEIDKKDYFFITKQKFQSYIRNNFFLEHIKNKFGYYYATPKNNILYKISQGIDIILEIDIEGATLIKEKCIIYNPLLKQCIGTIFLLPPPISTTDKIAELKKRLQNRNTETNQIINNRLKIAFNEIKYYKKYKYNFIIENKIFKETINKVNLAIDTIKNKTEKISINNKTDILKSLRNVLIE